MRVLLITLLTILHSNMIFDFNTSSNINDWKITNDVVMGGVSTSSITLDSEGNGVFNGQVSTENNGGFAMVRYKKSVSCEQSKNIKIRIKGDGKNYQFRIKSDGILNYWYVQTFETTGDWQIINLPLNEFYPSFRGMKLMLPDFDSDRIEEIAILIANEKTEKFELLIDQINLD